MTLQCHKKKLLWRFFGSGNLLFRGNKAIKSEIWTLFAHRKQIDQFLLGLFGKQDLILAQTWHGPSLLRKITPGKILWFRQLTFETKEINKIWNVGSFWKLKRNWPILGVLIWKAGLSFGPNFAWPFSVKRRHHCVSFLLKQFVFYTK